METQEKFTKLLNTYIITVEVPAETKVCDCDFICGYCKELWNLDPNFDYHKIGEATEDEISEELKKFLKLEWSWCEKEFRSLLQASGLNRVNPFSNKCKRETPPSKDFEHLKQWIEAERKKLKGKLIFLKIIK